MCHVRRLIAGMADSAAPLRDCTEPRSNTMGACGRGPWLAELPFNETLTESLEVSPRNPPVVTERQVAISVAIMGQGG